MNDQACPKCGAPVNAYGTPGCGCAILEAAPGSAPHTDDGAATVAMPAVTDEGPIPPATATPPVRPYVAPGPEAPVSTVGNTVQPLLPDQAATPSAPAPEDLHLFENGAGVFEDTAEFDPVAGPAPHGPGGGWPIGGRPVGGRAQARHE
ncbi:hypothetical protein ACFQLX_25015, partial [Streptomyces polyrhachis]